MVTFFLSGGPPRLYTLPYHKDGVYSPKIFVRLENLGPNLPSFSYSIFFFFNIIVIMIYCFLIKPTFYVKVLTPRLPHLQMRITHSPPTDLITFFPMVVLRSRGANPPAVLRKRGLPCTKNSTDSLPNPFSQTPAHPPAQLSTHPISNDRPRALLSLSYVLEDKLFRGDS